MKRPLKIWHLLILLLTLLTVFRFNYITGIIIVSSEYLAQVIFGAGEAVFVKDFFTFTDHFISALLVPILFITVILFRKKRLLSTRLTFTSGFFSFIFVFMLSAPLLSAMDYSFHKDLAVTRLLSPFSIKTTIALKPNREFVNKNSWEWKVNNIYSTKDLIFADSINTDNGIRYFQNGAERTIDTSRVQYSDGSPVTGIYIFLLGTDNLGRDIFPRLAAGARLSFFVSISAIIISISAGIVLGFFAGYYRKWTDSTLNRFAEILLAFPLIFLVIFLLSFFRGNLFLLILILGLTGWMILFKIIRTETIAITQKDYFVASGLTGLSTFQLLKKELLPGVVASVLINVIFQFGGFVIVEAYLGFLGLGIGNSYPSWGTMINTGQIYLNEAWWLIFFPSLLLVLILITLNNLGRSLNSYFTSSEK